ncbi:MAG: pilus assembly protein [Neisseria animaloris]|uniref:pilus assembly PilX family protein n=1 Tax=Neisseria animaloris TaxID=326522 RepID=UPI000D3611A0|nr:pilus assembly protein [Neisseria animaloris]MDO5073133.1 pilus assembly protein [Neisseria animaloris]
MRKSYILRHNLKAAQQGFSLFIVLIVMLVIAFLVVSATQSYNTEQRISTNDADRKFALSLAEAALQVGEAEILNFKDSQVVFSTNCSNGLCAAAGSEVSTTPRRVVQAGGDTPAWKRKKECGGSLCIDTNGKIYNVGSSRGRRNARYIVEYVGTQPDGSPIYRVTSKAWGKNNNTVVMLQSYISVE